MALRNEDLKSEIKQIMKADHWTQDAVANRMGIPQSYIHKIFNRDNVDKRLIEMMDIMGYDVEVRFVRKRRR